MNNPSALSKNRVLIAFVAFALLLALTVWLAKKRGNEAPTFSTTSLPKKLDVSSVDRLVLRTSQGQDITLEKKENAWVISEPIAGKADQNVIASALEQLDNMEAKSLVATNKDTYPQLEISDKKGVHVILGSKGKELANLWIGKTIGSSTLVRFEGKSEVYEMSGTFRYAFDKELKAWRDRVVVSEEPDKISKVRITQGKRSLGFERSADKSWVQSRSEAPIRRFDAAKVAALVSSISRLRADDIADRPAASLVESFKQPKATIELTSAEKTVSILLSEVEFDYAFVKVQDAATIFKIPKQVGNMFSVDAKAFEASAAAAQPSAANPPQELPENVKKALHIQ